MKLARPFAFPRLQPPDWAFRRFASPARRKPLASRRSAKIPTLAQDSRLVQELLAAHGSISSRNIDGGDSIKAGSEGPDRKKAGFPGKPALRVMKLTVAIA
jgi:hypothetical protein